MDDAVHSALAGWSNFYVIVGSASAALTGLMFIAVTLIAESEMRSSIRQIQAFGTPTIVHLVAPLVLSAICSVPWQQLAHLAHALEVASAAGMVYAAAVILLAYRQEGYEPVLADWLWFSILPLIAYATLTVAAFLLRGHPNALFVVGGVALTLLLIGLHNAWDTVTYVAIVMPNREGEKAEKPAR